MTGKFVGPVVRSPGVLKRFLNELSWFEWTLQCPCQKRSKGRGLQIAEINDRFLDPDSISEAERTESPDIFAAARTHLNNARLPPRP
jgi:hypothetical protein